MIQPNDHVLEHVDACLHGLLNDADAAAVRKHCDECPICRVAWDEAQRRFDALAALPAVETSSELIERTERRLNEAAARRRPPRVVRWLARRNAYEIVGLCAAVVVALLGSLDVYYWSLSPAPYDLTVFGQEQWLAGSESSVRVTVFNRASGALLAGIPVDVELERPLTNQTVQLASFQTDANGTGSPRFRLPDWEDARCSLRVSARIGGSRELITHSVAIHRSWQVMVTSDKPVYQPGQTIHVRSLALRRPDLKPLAGSDVSLTIADPKGNVIFRRRDVTSRYGISSADCPLADEILEGTYRVECRLGDTTSAMAVEVKRYVLPKFKVAIDVDRPYYQPGETISGTVRADYFFGKPVANADVRIDTASTDTSSNDTSSNDTSSNDTGHAAAESLTVRTDKEGKAPFSLRIPAALAHAQSSDEASLALKAMVVDSAGQTESHTISRVVTTSPLRIEVIPESGRLVPGISNVVYLMTSYADGRPAGTRLIVSGIDHEIVTSEAGIATVEFKPESAKNLEVSWIVRATDRQGLSGRKEIKLSVGRSTDDFLVRTDRAVYTGGQTMHVAAIGRGSEPVFIDLVKDGQTVVTGVIALDNGRGELALDLPADLCGTVELSAYRYHDQVRPQQKRRVLYVQQASSLAIRTRLDRKEYRPGQRAAIDLQLVDGSGRPTPGAISLTAVDEAVFSVLNQTSGNEQSIFTMDDALLKPVLARHAWSPSADRSAERNQFEQAIFAQSAAPSTNDRETILDRLRQTRDFDQSAIRILDQPNWEQYLSDNYVPSKVMAILRNDGIHSLYSTSYPDKADAVERTRNNGLGLLAGLWVVFAIVGVGSLIGIFVYEAGGSVAAAVVVPIFILILIALMLPAVQAAREASKRTMMRNEAKMVALAVADSSRSMRSRINGADVDTDSDGLPDFQQSASSPPRLRQWFPETLLWRPEIITDDRGEAHVDVDLADSVTTWRLTASAVSAEGQLGSSQSAVRVFQPFFVDVNLPVALLRGDEVGVPVVVHNHLDKPQTVALTVDDATWFERLGPAQQSVALGPREVKSVTYRLRVRKIGDHHLQVAALGSGVADAVKRPISVVPDGRRVERVVNGTLGQPKAIDIERPAEAIDGSRRTILKIYPSSFSQLVEGLDSIFQMPYGCFEQTSSTTYPNLLALDYLRRTKTSAPAIEAKAQQYLHLGYQRLLSFEVLGGGFEWFGHDPANRVLTAYGLMEFEEMARVHEVDPQVIARTQHWLLSHQAADGSWTPESHGFEGDPTRGQGDDGRLSTTAYIAWSVFKRGLVPEQATLSLHYLLGHPANSIDDPYTLALVANALLAIDASGANAAPYLDRLAALRRESNGGTRIWWQQRPSRYTMFYGGGRSGEVETTALAALAFLAANRSPDAIRGALAWIIEQKEGAGTWGSTQATVLALKALIEGTGKPLGEGARRIQLSLDGKPLPEIVIPADQSEVVRQIDLTDRLGTARQTLQLTDASGTAAGFQVVSSYYAPDTSSKPHAGDLAVNVNYDRQKLPLNGTLTATATVENKSERTAPMILVELPIPAGFALDMESFSKLVESGAIAKFQIGARTATIYLRGIKDKSVVTLLYRMQATMPATLTVPPAVAYEYYNAEKRATSQPVQIVVDVAG
jgi:uncharacterized protein YfaS (alpha-2-macroglobulin family)